MTDNKDFVMVPREPTPEQVRAGQLGVTTDCVKAIYAAMLQAAPAPESHTPTTPAVDASLLWLASVRDDFRKMADKANRVLHDRLVEMATAAPPAPAQAPQVMTDAPELWAIFDSQGYYNAVESEEEARRFCDKYNARDVDPLKPYTVRRYAVQAGSGDKT